MEIQGRIRNLGLSITRGEVLLSQSRSPPDDGGTGCELSRLGAEAGHGCGPVVAVVFGAAPLGADQGLVVEMTQRYIDRGFTFVAVGSDLLLAQGAQCLRASFGEPA